MAGYLPGGLWQEPPGALESESTFGVTHVTNSSRHNSSNAIGCDLIPCDQAVIEAVSSVDKKYFDDHPEASERERDFVPGEGPFPHAPEGYVARVLVTKLAPSMRTRTPFFRKSDNRL